MKKSILTFVITILLFSCGQKSNKPLNSTENQYKKKIFELGIQYQKVYEYEYKFGEPDEKSAFLTELIEFDRKGNAIRSETHNKSKYLKEYDEIEFFSYDTAENHAETVVKDTLGNTKSIIKYKFEDALKERLSYSADGKLESKVIYKFDNNGNTTELISYNSNGEIEYKKVYKYNSKNEEIEEKEYDKKSDLESSSKLIEMSDGKKELQFYNKDKELINSYIYLKNAKGQIIESMWIDVKEDKTTKTVNKFDNNDLLVEIIVYENNGEPSVLKKIERIKFQK